MNPENALNEVLEKLSNSNESSSTIAGQQTAFFSLIKEHDIETFRNIDSDKLCRKLCFQLLSPVKTIRRNCFRCMLLTLPLIRTENIEKYHIDLHLVRAIDEGGNKNGEDTQEGVEALKFVYCLSKLDRLSRSIVCCLISLVKSITSEVYIKCGTAILCNYIIKDPNLVIECGGIKSILHRIMMGGNFQDTEVLTQLLVFLFSRADTRTYIHLHYDIGFLLAPLSDSFFVLFEKKGDFKSLEVDYREDRKIWRAACKNTILSIARTWPGLFTITPIFEEFMCALKRPFPEIQRTVLDIIYDLFLIRQPESLNSFESALSSVIDQKQNIEWSISEDWIANEAYQVLPPHHIERPDLVRIYQATVLALMLKVDPKLDSITHVAINGNEQEAILAAILIGEVLHLINKFNLISEQHIAHIQPLLVEAVTENRGYGEASSHCISKLLNHRRSQYPTISFHLRLIKDHVQLYKEYTNDLSIVSEDRQQNNFLEETKVLSTDDFLLWNWKKISSLIDLGFFRLQRDDAATISFLKRVVEKFTSQYMLVMLPLYDKETGEENSSTYTNVGIALMNVLLEIECHNIDELKDLIPSFLDNICEELLKVKFGSGIFSPHNMTSTLVRDYFFIIGALLSDMQGFKYLKKSKILETYCEISDKCCNSNGKDILMKCIIASLTYGQQEVTDAIFSKIVHHGSKSVRLFAVKFMRCLMRTGHQNFDTFILPTLIKQLYGYNGDNDEIVDEALDILAEACQDQACKEHLLALFPSLIHLGNKGYNLFIQFLSIPGGYEKLLELGFVDSEIEVWKEWRCIEYVKRTEEILMEAFTSYEPGECFGRLSDTSLTVVNKKHCYPPPHLFGELAHCDVGIEKLESENIFEFIQKYLDSGDDMKIKAAAWAIGHIGTSSYGFAKLSKREMVFKIHHLSLVHPNLNIRGTCFFALNLICKTESGCATLESLDFTASHDDIVHNYGICQNKSKDFTMFTNKIQDPNRQRSHTLQAPKTKSHVKNRSIGNISINQIDMIIQSVKQPQEFDSQDIQKGDKIGLCIPNDIQSYFSLNFDFRRPTVPDLVHDTKQDKVDEKADEMLNLVINLSSTLKSGYYFEQLKELSKSESHVFADFSNYVRVHKLMSQYTFRQNTRRFIHKLFESSLKNAEIFLAE